MSSTHRAYNSITYKINDNHNNRNFINSNMEKENSENLMNFSDNNNMNIHIDPNHSINFLKKNKNNITNNLSGVNSSNDFSKKNTSRLEMKDLENYENDYKNSNWKKNKSYSVRNKEDANRKKTKLSLYSNSNNGNFENVQFSYSEKYYDNTNNETSQKSQKDEINWNNEDDNRTQFSTTGNILEKLQNLKNRTQGILEVYAKKINSMNGNAMKKGNL